VCQAPNKQLQRTVPRHRGDGASAPFHYALAPRFTRQRATAQLRRYSARFAAAACSLVFAIPCANAAELLESVQLVNGGAVLSCDYTHPDDSFTFTCRDAYTVFALRCVSVPWSALRVQRVGQQEFLCPVSTERSAFGNALRLRCSAYGDERRALFARQTLADKAEPATCSGRPYADARLRIGQGGMSNERIASAG
jgi:hypothetical protein